MTEIIHGDLYDFPKYYDLLFGSDWKAEYDFLLACFDRYAKCKVKRVFEPACGTGRLLIKLAQKAGLEVSGNDLNEKAVAFCNARFQKAKLADRVEVGDMSNFTVKKKFHASFNTINSFRHLSTERQAVGHLKCMAEGLTKGGLYILGIHLTPTVGDRMESESWVARRGNLQVNSVMWSKELDLKKRNEHLGLTIDVYTPTNHIQLHDTMDYRTYTAKQMKSLLAKVPEFEVVALHDFRYEMDDIIEIEPNTEDVVFVLRKR
ncbi:MAG: class I SAM-dependent methyltransferase [Planctomycetaceae bacterium]|nr:class I SAM-dependent methyltransferase [Planctomycetaceae bacterium]MCB9952366.1 class I SAM-dependent methyltransferase [Planctomycetaceae bacterium]